MGVTQQIEHSGATLAAAHPNLVLPPQWPERYSAHGDYARWAAAIDGLPQIDAIWRAPDTVRIEHASGDTLTTTQRHALRTSLEALMPWRKGPWRWFDLPVQTEWRSDWKWQRLAPALPDLDGACLLDVGCGNGFFGWHLLTAGARSVVGVDPTVLFCMQHLAINRYAKHPEHWVLPLRFEELPAYAFDGVLSMGVIYHRRDPQAHADQLFACTRPGGWAVLESLVVTAGDDLHPAPEARYARMRNVWCVPNLRTLVDWLTRAGFTDVNIVDVNPTHILEQSSTGWMRFESLPEALHPTDPTRTVEGFPAPVRAIALAQRPE